MVSLPARPENSSAVLLGLLDPVMVSANEEPEAEPTPENVSVPTDASPLTMPDAPLLVLVQVLRPKVIVTPAVALKYTMRVLPLPVIVSSPPSPSNWLKVPLFPALLTAGSRKPEAPKLVATYVSANMVP